jgi:GNAT superfamily N-acetyltransferase
MTSEIRIATTDEELASCYPVMAELRPHLSLDQFMAMARRLGEATRLRIAYLTEGESIVCVAGFRVSEWLAGGRYLEIEDLVTDSSARSKGHGGVMFDWLVRFASEAQCKQVRLVSNVRRIDAHRFYERKGMAREAYYFSMNVKSAD